MQPAISIINKSELEEGRLDAEYYQPVYIRNKKLLDSRSHDTLGNLTKKIVVGYVSSMVSQYTDKGVDLLQTRNVAEFFTNTDDVIKINEDFHTKLKKSQVRKGDILVARSGSFGIASIYLDDRVVNSADIIIIDADEAKINPYYLTAYLNSEKGRLQLYRFASGGLQGHVNTTILHNLQIVSSKPEIDNKIQEIVTKAYSLREESKKYLTELEQSLLSHLGFADFTPSTVNYSSRSSKEATEADRFDSEYWLPKYNQLLEVINKQEHVPLASLFHKPVKGIEVGSSEYVAADGIPFVRVSDFSVFGIDEDTDKRISIEAYEKLKDDYKPKVGELLFTKDGTVGITAVLDKEVECILSGAFLRLKPKSDIDPHYLALLINSMVCKTQIERLSGGALITHFKPDELAKIVVPIVDEQTQKQIGDEVRNAFQLRNQSKALLEIAKRAVEIFIEQDEDAALEYLIQSQKK